jgi:hypothetical protein
MANEHRFAEFDAELAQYAHGVHSLDPAATDDEIRQIEQVIPTPLPGVYREFLIRHNGGSLFCDSWNLYGVPRREFPLQVDLVQANRGRRWPGMPAEWFIIGSTAWGDRISLITETGTDQTKVTQWDHERGRVAQTWPSFEEWLTDTMTTGSRSLNYDGSRKHYVREQAWAAIRKLFGKQSER